MRRAGIVAAVTVAVMAAGLPVSSADAISRDVATRVAQRYLDAISRSDWRRVCAMLGKQARQDLLDAAEAAGEPAGSCRQAAGAMLFPQLGDVDIAAVTTHGRTATVWVIHGNDPDTSGNFRVRRVAGRWRVLDL
ncbi:MAG: hypothetical protein R2736_12450 [Solirubrobacterales bacterium]